MLLRTGVLALVLTVPFAAARAQPPGASPSQGQMDESGLIKAPPNATLVGKSIVDEIRAFPEMSKSGKQKAQAEKIVGIEGVDRIFTVDRSFAETVSFLDQQFKQSGFQQLARVETPSATAWTIKRPDGTVANAVVRNTNPTTIEIAEASTTATTVPPPR